jgi:hypothetical protein
MFFIATRLEVLMDEAPTMSLSGILTRDAASQARRPLVEDRLRAVAALS